MKARPVALLAERFGAALGGKGVLAPLERGADGLSEAQAVAFHLD